MEWALTPVVLEWLDSGKIIWGMEWNSAVVAREKGRVDLRLLMR